MKRAVALVTLCLLAATGASTARADFDGQTIDTGKGLRPIALVGNDRGDRLLVYDTGTGMRVAFGPAGRPFRAPQDVPDTRDAYAVQAVVGPTGAALVAWKYDDKSTPPEEIDIRDGGCCFGAKAVIVADQGRTVGPVTTLWPRGTDVYQPRYAIYDARRFGVVAQTETLNPGTRNYPAPSGTQGRFARTGAWGRTERVPGARDVRALAGTRSGTRLIYSRSSLLVGRVRSDGGRWSREQRLLAGFPVDGSGLVRADASGGLIATWTAGGRRDVALKVAAGAPGRKARARTVDRVSGDGILFALDLQAAGNGAALVTWSIGRQIYRSERPAHGRFSGRRLAFASDIDAPNLGFAVSAANRWAAAVQTGGRFKDDPYRLRARTARFGGPVSGLRLIGSGSELHTVPPVIDRAGRITFASAGAGAIGVRTGR